MEEPSPQHIDELLGELQDEYGARSSTTAEVPDLLRRLKAERHRVRTEAIRQLAKLKSSSRPIVEALLAVAASDPAYAVRQAATQALRAPAHLEILVEDPELMDRTSALVGRPDPGAEPVRQVVPADGTDTGQSLLAYRLAAIVLFLGVVVQVAHAVVCWVYDVPTEPEAFGIGSAVVDVLLAIGLLQARSGARTWVLFRAGLGAIVGSIVLYTSQDALSATLGSVAQWGYCGSLILLLTGRSKTWRLVLAMASFVVLVLGLSGAGLVGTRLSAEAGPIPDLSDVMLTAEDLPGAVVLSLEEMGLEPGESLTGDLTAESAFAWLDWQSGAVGWGATILLPTVGDQRGFDRDMREEDVLLQQFGAGMGTDSGSSADPAELIDTAVGEASVGLTVPVTIEGTAMRVDCCIFRRGAAAAFVSLMYDEGQVPSVSSEQAAHMLDLQFIQALAEAELAAGD